jgi:hypothetical protein
MSAHEDHPMTPRPTALGSSFILSIAIAMAVAGCMGSPASTGTPASAPAESAPIPTAASTPTPAPTITTAPAASPATTPAGDVARLFTAKQLDPQFAGSGPITGTMSVGTLEGTISGAMSVQGGNSAFHATIEVPGLATSSSYQVKVDGREYQSSDGILWFEVGPATGGAPASGSSDGGLDEAMMVAALTVTDQGVVTKLGRPLHRLVPDTAADLTAADFGLTGPSAVDATGTIEFYAHDDGTLAVMTVSLAWNADLGGGSTVPARIAMDFTFDDEAVAEIRPPDVVWSRFTSEQHGYTIGYPSAWYLRASKSDSDADAFAASPAEFAMAIRERQPKAAADNLAAYVRAFKRATGWKVEIDEATQVSGRPAWRLAYHHKVNGEMRYWVFTLLVQGRNGYMVGFVSPAGSEADVLAFHELQLTTLSLPGD